MQAASKVPRGALSGVRSTWWACRAAAEATAGPPSTGARGFAALESDSPQGGWRGWDSVFGAATLSRGGAFHRQPRRLYSRFIQGEGEKIFPEWEREEDLGLKGTPTRFGSDDVISDEDAKRVAKEMTTGSHKRRRIVADAVLAGTYFRSPDEEGAEDMDIEMDGMVSIFDVKRTRKTTKSGVLSTATALVAIGNGRGVISVATGKAEEADGAIKKAFQNAKKKHNFVAINLYKGFTLHHEIKHTFMKTTVFLKPMPFENGVKAGHLISSICRLVGIKSLTGRIIGQKNPWHAVRAVLEALALQKDQEAVALEKGTAVIRWRKPPRR